MVITTADPAVRERAKVRNATLPNPSIQLSLHMDGRKHLTFRLMCRVGSKTRPEMIRNDLRAVHGLV